MTPIGPLFAQIVLCRRTLLAVEAGEVDSALLLFFCKFQAGFDVLDFAAVAVAVFVAFRRYGVLSAPPDSQVAGVAR